MDNVIERYEELLLLLGSKEVSEVTDPMEYDEEWQEYFELKEQINLALNNSACI